MARRNPLEFFLEAARTYGDVVSLQLGLRRAYLVSHPDHVKLVLQDSHHAYCKGPPAARVRPLFGDSLTTIDGERWHRQRQLVRSAFQPQRLTVLVPVIVEATAAMLDRWESLAGRGQPLDLLSEMTRLTRVIILRVVFGDVAAEEARAVGQTLDIAFEDVNQRLWSALGWLRRVPTPRNRRRGRALRALDAFVRSRLAESRYTGGTAGSLLSTLLEARDERTGEGMSDGQLASELKALLFAGHTTTSSALAWVWYLLSQNPEAECSLEEEVHAVLGERPPTAEDLAALRYTRMLIEEALRLYPPTWLTARMPLADDELGGYPVPANVIVLLSPFVTHRHPTFWKDPERFNPERFRPEQSAGRPRFAYFPFGGGPRACIGSGLALMEIQLVVAMVAQRYRLTLMPGCRVEPDPGITLRPRHAILMILHRNAPRGSR